MRVGRVKFEGGALESDVGCEGRGGERCTGNFRVSWCGGQARMAHIPRRRVELTKHSPHVVMESAPWMGMSTTPRNPPSSFFALELALETVALAKPWVVRLQRHDRELFEQTRRALTRCVRI